MVWTRQQERHYREESERHWKYFMKMEYEATQFVENTLLNVHEQWIFHTNHRKAKTAYLKKWKATLDDLKRPEDLGLLITDRLLRNEIQDLSNLNQMA